MLRVSCADLARAPCVVARLTIDRTVADVMLEPTLLEALVDRLLKAEMPHSMPLEFALALSDLRTRHLSSHEGGSPSVMTAAHTMTPGRIVHWLRPGASGVACVPAVITASRGTPATGFYASLVVFTLDLQPASDMRMVRYDPRAVVEHTSVLPAEQSWHWIDECPYPWPQTD